MAAGALIRLVGAPAALLADAVLLLISVVILRGLDITRRRIGAVAPGRAGRDAPVQAPYRTERAERTAELTSATDLLRR